MMIERPDYRVLALDLDGTLTDSQKRVTPPTRRALEKAAALGVRIVLTSGRPLMGIKKLADDIDMGCLNGFIIAGNGAQLVKYRTGEMIYTSQIPIECLDRIEEIAAMFDVAALCYDEQGVISARPDDKYVRLEAFNNGLPITCVTNLRERAVLPAPKAMIVGEPDKLARCFECARAFFEGTMHVFMSERFFMECTAMGNSKAHALERLLNYLGEPREALMACGDGLNDLEMLVFAGLGVAMQNSYPEVLEAADAVTASNDQDGVARAIYKYILREEYPG